MICYMSTLLFVIVLYSQTFLADGGELNMPGTVCCLLCYITVLLLNVSIMPIACLVI